MLLFVYFLRHLFFCDFCALFPSVTRAFCALFVLSKKIIKRGIKHTKDNLSEKGIFINNKSVDLIIIIYKNLNIVDNKFSKVISFIDTFLRKFGKIIFVIDDKNEEKSIMENMQFVCDVSKVASVRFALELNNNNLLSYVKF